MKVVLGIRGIEPNTKKVVYRCDEGFKGSEDEAEVAQLVTEKLNNEYFDVAETLELLTPKV